MGKKLFGNSKAGGRFSGNQNMAPRYSREPAREEISHPKAKKQKKKGKAAIWLLSIVLTLEILYCIAIFSNIPFIVRLRETYIQTAMSTMSHHWLAEAFIPHDIVQDVVLRSQKAREAQIGHVSNWGDVDETDATGGGAGRVTPGTTEETEEQVDPEEQAFYELFDELDHDSTAAYLNRHPEYLKNGWDNLYINQAGLDDNGTTIETTEGDQVLAIDVPNQILLIRVTGSNYRGVLAIAKKPENLHLYCSSTYGVGQHAGVIAENHDGVLAVTGSGFIDDGGHGNGGEIAGYCMSDGESHGNHFGWGYKRLELHEDNRLYIREAYDPVSEDTTDAMEFWPAMIVDGEILVNEDWMEINPRCSVGQTKDKEIMMLVVEGRLPGYSLGTTVLECTNIMAKYGCYQAMNMDGGTSAILWYDGEYVTRCSNTANTEGRYLPNAWVYTK